MPTIDVTDVLKRTQGTGNGSLTEFSFSFQVNATNEIKVYEDATLKTEGTHYDIVDSTGTAGLNANGTGVVKFKTSPSDYTPGSGKIITIVSLMSLARSSVYTSGGNITASSLEADYDKIHRILGDFKEAKSRTLIAPEHDATDIDMTLPKEADRASSYLYFDSDGNPTTTSLLTTLSIGTGIIFEGSTADAHETTLTVADPTGSDKTITLPNATGTVSLLTNTETLTNKTLTSPVLNTGVSGTAVKDQDDMSSNSATHLATQQSIKAYVDAQVTASDLDFQGDSGGALSIDLDSETLDIAGGTGIDTSGSSNTLTVAIDSTVATLTGEQTLTNKTLTRPVMTTGTSGGAGNSVLIGYNAGYNAGSSHTYNVGIGYEAFAQMGTATNHYNVGIGYYALHDDGSSNNLSNVAIGNSALKFVDGANYNIGIGYQSLMAPNSSNHLTGDYNIAIGHEAGEGISSGSGNILLGYEANASSATATNELVIKTYDGSNAVTYLTGSASGTTGTITIPGNIVLNGTISGTGVDADLSSVSASDDTLASAKAIKTYVDAKVTAEDLDITSDSGTIAIDLDSETLTIAGGTGLSSSASSNTVTLAVDAAQTGITSLLATDIKIGEDDQTKIDFETADTINFYAGNEKQLILTDGALTPGTNAILDLGTDALEFKDAYFDGTVEADAITIGGTAIGSIYSPIAGGSSIVTTGALNSGSITSGFGTIDTGSSAITTTGLISGGSLDIDNVLIDGTTIGHTDDTDLITLADGAVTVAGDLTLTSTDAGAGNDPSFILYRNSSSPADYDDIGEILFRGRNWDGSATVHDVEYGKIWCEPYDVTDGNENARMHMDTMLNGDLTNVWATGWGNIYYNHHIALDTSKKIYFRGATANSNWTTLTVTDPTANRTITLPDVTGTVLVQDSNDDVIITSTDAGATDDPSLILYRNSSSPADYDDMGEIVFRGRNDNSQDVDYARIWTEPYDVSDGTEGGRLRFDSITSGTQTNIFASGWGYVWFDHHIHLNAGKFLQFEGATNDEYETIVTGADPTADRTITLPDATGTVALTSPNILAGTLLATTTVSDDATVDFNSTYVTSTYDHYDLLITGLIPATDNTWLGLRFGTANSADSGATKYAYTCYWIGASDSDSYQINYNSDNQSSTIVLVPTTNFSMGTGTGEGLSMHLRCWDLSSTSLYKKASPMGAGTMGAGAYFGQSYATVGGYKEASAVNFISLYSSSGNLASGTVSLYGIKKG